MPRIKYGQARFITLIVLTWLAIFVVTRGALLVTHLSEAGTGARDVLRIFGTGFIYDAGFLLYVAAPLCLLLALLPARWWPARPVRLALRAILYGLLALMLFTAVAEWLFWDEFGVRFNFIAVDYLVYSREVVDNVRESYPLGKVFAAIGIGAAALALVLEKNLRRAFSAPAWPRHAAWGSFGLLSAAAVLGGLTLDQDFPRGNGGNIYQRELAGNGPFQFFAAFRNNELDYRQFYATLPDNRVADVLRQEVAAGNAHFVGDDPEDIRRVIDNPGTPLRKNVVLVTVESLSAKYLGSFGDTRGLTPNLDALRRLSLSFGNFYATGTRTDRGLEAVTLSIPPTPGRSIVKRIGRETGYASLGQQFSAQGYDSIFLYGGRGYFDNMNAFFSGNGYRTIDQSSVPDTEIAFQNAWGMSDEDIYRQALKVADADAAADKPFFMHIMTTSNHRPYTYPAGRIDIPSGEGREGAVKYTDFAIGQFLAEARKKPWFAQTVFVFLADHTAGSAGKEDLPVENYHIPLFIYAPSFVTPREFTGLASQIDVAPTLLGLLNFSYTSTFFGHDLLRDGSPGRALIGNYQHLGLFDGSSLAILSPRQGMRRHDNALGNSREHHAKDNDPLLERAIAYYQGASHNFQFGLLSWIPTPFSSAHLVRRDGEQRDASVPVRDVARMDSNDRAKRNGG